MIKFIRILIRKKVHYIILSILLLVILIGYVVPNKISSPIVLKDIEYWDSSSFWYYPWGVSGAHKGVDIFCKKGTNVISPVNGFVCSTGYGTVAGYYVYIIGSKWRTYYFAHLDTVVVEFGTYINRGELIGKTGNSGNAIDKPTHLHYSIKTIFPYFWNYDRKAFESWRKIFYINPIPFIK
jgi:peptidoglycan LD-endopeptidase LytH